MKVLFLLGVVLGLAWVAKGAMSLVQGRGADYWGDDFLFGGLILTVGVVGLVRAMRATPRAGNPGRSSSPPH